LFVIPAMSADGLPANCDPCVTFAADRSLPHPTSGFVIDCIVGPTTGSRSVSREEPERVSFANTATRVGLTSPRRRATTPTLTQPEGDAIVRGHRSGPFAEVRKTSVPTTRRGLFVGAILP
jgi:hypothetical protein